MANNHLVQPSSTLQQHSNKHRLGVWTTILVLGPIAAALVLGGGTRISDGFEPFEKSANERVFQAFEEIKGLAPVSDDLRTALASLSQSVQGTQNPPVKAEGQ
ncbi:hypothetical protein [Bradyrhizobium sp. Gha]|uniref:hypothetical protein n=1 Tax=Bradyrhizobium sp. Gha TaxID=1855318 RepID=UPI0008E67A27|nr:hypothetical protein [Bradyrhizobium sp. Gha]SFH82348.1 hypothetical protein SAMN05216525_102139 [Bradyrhizobium sp. Gha]